MNTKILFVLLISAIIINIISLATSAVRVKNISSSEHIIIGNTIEVKRMSARYHSWTKAIYSDGYIQDYYIECVNDELISMKPCDGINTVCKGEKIFVGEDWKDPRMSEWQAKLC